MGPSATGARSVGAGEAIFGGLGAGAQSLLEARERGVMWVAQVFFGFGPPKKGKSTEQGDFSQKAPTPLSKGCPEKMEHTHV